MGHITNFGSAKDLFALPGRTSVQAQAIWSGSISLGQSPAAVSAARTATEQAIRDLDRYFVPVDFAAPTRCIDGRAVEGYNSDPLLHGRGLGPQTAGGTPSAALVHRLLLMGEQTDGKLSFTDDIETILTLFTRHGMSFGGHIDDTHGIADEDTGCGAIDKLPQILQKMVDPQAWNQLHGLAKHLLGAAYDERMVNQVSGRLLRLEAVANEYLMYDPHQVSYGYKQQVMGSMRRMAADTLQPIERLTGQHNEKGLVINLLPGTTFDRDRFSSDNNNQIQLFNWDIWRSRQTAKLLYPISDAMAYDAASEQLRYRYEYVLCRTLYTLATAMVLTDGTPLVLIRS